MIYRDPFILIAKFLVMGALSIIFSLTPVCNSFPAHVEESSAETAPAPSNQKTGQTIYEDQVIEDSSLQKELEKEALQEKALFPHWGPGTMGAAYRFYHEDFNDRLKLFEHGLELSWRQETIENGSFEILADGLTRELDDERKTDGGRFSIHQQDFSLNPALRLASDLGHFRTYTPQLINRSYRLTLPTTLLQGVSARVYNQRTIFALNAGEIGEYKGTAARAFEKTQGNLQGMGILHEFNKKWNTGAQMWQTELSDSDEVYQSITGVLEYDNDEKSHNQQLHALVDSEGSFGTWYDAELWVKAWRHNTGLYYLEPDLRWTDAPISDDREGIYWRSYRKSFRWRWTVSDDLFRNNIKKSNEFPGYVNNAFYGDVNWRWQLKTSLGASVNMDNQFADSGTAENDKLRYLLKTYVTHQSSLGTSLIEPKITYIERPEASTTYGLRWDQQWRPLFLTKLETDIEYLQNTRKDDQFTISLIADKYFDNDFIFSGKAQHVISHGQVYGKSEQTSFTLDLSWNFHSNWLASLSSDYNVNGFNLEDGSNAETEFNDFKVLFSLSYAVDTGKQPALYGNQTDTPGRGRIVGQVFQDNNKNGRFDIGEEAIAGITVYLDRRFRTETGRNGRFEFWPVPAGDHVLSIAIEDIPLPWGLDDEEPQHVVVPSRGKVEFDFALTRLGE